MKLAVLSDIHVLGAGELERAREVARSLGLSLPFFKRQLRRGLFRLRRRFWNWHAHSREACFLAALDDISTFDPDWVVAGGDYGGDTHGVGISHDDTFESVSGAIELIRSTFPGKAQFVFGDHELGKYSTELQKGGIRLDSLVRGERLLGIRSFWKEIDGPFHLIGINSSLFTLDIFIPEAIPEEMPEWMRYRDEHLAAVSEAFEALPAGARVILFCHDPGALAFLHDLPAVRSRLHRIERTILGHLHAPRLLPVTKLLSRLPAWRPRYPVARIIAASARGARTWAAFKPIVCPSTFGAGHHISGGVLFIETDTNGTLIIRRHRISC